jgi:hypothetical protein
MRRRIATISFVLVVLIAGGVTIALARSGSATAPITRMANGSSSCIPPAFSFSAPRPPLPKELSTPLDATILSSFAIFRRSALPSDELSGLKPGGDGLDRELSKLYEILSYYPAYVRHLIRLPDGRRYFVIPAYGRSEAVVPAHCLAGEERERSALVEEQHRRLVEPVDCIIEVGGGENASPPGCEPFAAIDEGGRVFQADALTKEPIVELVPDGVASVRIAYRETPAVVVPVSENAFMFTPPPPTPRVKAELKRLYPGVVATHLSKAQRRRITLQWDKTVDETEPTNIEWLNSSGVLVRALSPPTAESYSATSVGNLDAPLEGSTTVKSSRSSSP